MIAPEDDPGVQTGDVVSLGTMDVQAKHLVGQRNLSAIQQNYINKLIKLRSEVNNW